MSSLLASNEGKELEANDAVIASKNTRDPSSPIADRKCPPICFDGFTPANGRPASGPLKKRRIKDRCSLDSSYSLPFTPSGFFDITPNVASQKNEPSSTTRDMEVPPFRMPMKDISTNTTSMTYTDRDENRGTFSSGRDDTKKLAFSPRIVRNLNKLQNNKANHDFSRNTTRLVGPAREQPEFLLPMHSPIAFKASNDYNRSLERSNASFDRKNTYMGLIRQQLEFFEISNEEVAFCKTKNVSVHVGQVALRCRHCTCVSMALRPRGSMIVAMEHISLYKHFLRGKNIHMEGLCHFVPSATQKELMDLRKQRGATNAQDLIYWSTTAKDEGVVETRVGLRFKSSLSIAKNSNLGLLGSKADQRNTTNTAPSKKKRPLKLDRKKPPPIELKIDDETYCGNAKTPASTLADPQDEPTLWLESMREWHTRFQEFVDFKIRNGHGKVPEKFPENPPLAVWANEQRTAKREKDHGIASTMTDERQSLLEKAGFVWDFETSLVVQKSFQCWDKQFCELQKFYEQKGHSNVPTKTSTLGRWVSKMRRAYKDYTQSSWKPDYIHKDEMDRRIRLLEGLNFSWSVVKENRKANKKSELE